MGVTLLRQLVQVLLMGETLSLRSTLDGRATIDDPTLGHLEASDLARLGALWRDRGAARDPRWIAVTATDSRVVGEFEIEVKGPEGTVPLPVAIVAEPGDGPTFRSVRIYHSSWPMRENHAVRPPVVDCTSEVELPEAVARYQEALAAGDLGAILACFSDVGYVREPAGGRWLHRGADGLRRFYTALFSNGGGIPLRHCTATDDGTRCAIEYVTTVWGRTEIPAQAGVAVYERAGDALTAARIYDDIDPPL